MSKDLEKQVIGRAQRLGRKDPLIIKNIDSRKSIIELSILLIKTFIKYFHNFFLYYDNFL